MRLSVKTQAEVDKDLNDRSYLGAVIYFVSWSIVVLFSNVKHLDGTIVYGTGVFLLCVAIYRVVMAQRFSIVYESSPKRWRIWFSVVTLCLSAGPWSLYSAWCLSMLSIGVDGMIIMLPIVMVSTGGVYSLTPSRSLYVLFAIILIVPQFLALITIPSAESYSVATMLALFLVFMLLVSKNASNDYLTMLAQKERSESSILELKQAKEDAELSSQAKSRFLSSMSHELRTPMNAILGFGQLLELDDGLNEDQKEGVTQITKAGRYLLGLINEVLDLQKIESGEVGISLQPVLVDSTIQECLPLITGYAAKRGIRIEQELQAGVYVHSDHMRLKQALLNLLSNAAKYNRDKGRILIKSYTTDEREACIEITDTGHGVPGENIDELFQPFHRLGHNSDNIEGTGIGLALTKRLIELMSGEIQVQSEVGKGTTFSIRLPLEKTESPVS